MLFHEHDRLASLIAAFDRIEAAIFPILTDSDTYPKLGEDRHDAGPYSECAACAAERERDRTESL